MSAPEVEVVALAASIGLGVMLLDQRGVSCSEECKMSLPLMRFVRKVHLKQLRNVIVTFRNCTSASKTQYVRDMHFGAVRHAWAACGLNYLARNRSEASCFAKILSGKVLKKAHEGLSMRWGSHTLVAGVFMSPDFLPSCGCSRKGRLANMSLVMRVIGNVRDVNMDGHPRGSRA